MKRFNIIVVTVLLAVVLLVSEIMIVKSVSGYEPVSSVVYARVRIPADALIQAGMLREKKINISLVHKQSFRNIKDAMGKKAKVDIEEGEMILSGKLGSNEEMEKIKANDKNSRLFSVEFKGDQANGWWLMVGQYVDIIYVPDSKPGQQDIQEKSTGMNIRRIRNIRIAALIDDNGKLLGNNTRATLPKYVSFEVNDKQDEFLAYAKSNGRLEISVIPESPGKGGEGSK